MEHYGTEHYPDNFNMGYSADIIKVEDGIYQLGFNFYLGDFNLGFGMNFCYPYERYLNEADAIYLYNRLVLTKLWMNNEPVVDNNIIKSLFPEYCRHKFIEDFINDEVS